MLASRKIKDYKEIEDISKELHKDKKKIVFVSGTFDILHVGHAKFLEFAKSHGDILIVSIGQDSMIRAYKGPNKPINNEMHRAQLIASLDSTDYVVIGHEPYDGVTDVTVCIRIIKPDVFIVPTTDKPEVLTQKQHIADEVGAKLYLYHREELSDVPHISTTKILEEMKKNDNTKNTS